MLSRGPVRASPRHLWDEALEISGQDPDFHRRDLAPNTRTIPSAGETWALTATPLERVETSGPAGVAARAGSLQALAGQEAGGDRVRSAGPRAVGRENQPEAPRPGPGEATPVIAV